MKNELAGHRKLATLAVLMRLALRLWWMLSLLTFAGCGGGDDSAYCHGQQCLRQGKKDLALRYFLVATQRGGRHAGDAHLECAEIYLGEKRDPIAAIYHYRQYLRHAPRDRQASLVLQRISTAEKAFLEQIPLLRQRAGESTADLLRTMRLLQEDNARLKQQQAALLDRLRQLRARSADNPIATVDGARPTAIADENAASASRGIHTVGKGDTLSSISLQTYGTANRWRDIYEANRGDLPSPAKLRIGQQLILP
ncbi:MAG: LysM peptidoglycan-binding domain-containing protein [Puniceicoccales bacterium]|nr:LysM peptidoglycan-binding domain-containing protein [Puniceicoccales bacterium]